jgi:hypothetical protein
LTTIECGGITESKWYLLSVDVEIKSVRLKMAVDAWDMKSDLETD